MKNILIAIPAFNEEDSIEKIVKQCLKYSKNILVVDDGSSDDTYMKAEIAGARVIRHESNMGKGSAIKTIFKFVKSMNTDVLVILDGDEQHNPHEIPLFVSTIIEKGIDVVIGSRFLSDKNYIPFYRKIGLFVLTLLTNYCSGIYLSDSQCGFRAFSKKAIECLEITENGFAVESEMQFFIKEKNLSYREIPITVRYHKNAKRNPIKHGFSVLFWIIIFNLKNKLNIVKEGLKFRENRNINF